MTSNEFPATLRKTRVPDCPIRPARHGRFRFDFGAMRNNPHPDQAIHVMNLSNRAIRLRIGLREGARNASRLRRIVIQENPAWKPSSTEFLEQRAVVTFGQTPFLRSDNAM